MRLTKQFRDILFSRFLFSLIVVLFIRIGTFLPVPVINQNDLAFYIQRHSVTKNLITTFSGENTFVIGLFTLNIFPYINATIFVQLFSAFSPQLAELQKDGDFRSRRTISILTRFITLIWAVIQSIGIASYLRQVLFDWSYILSFQIILWLTTGAMIVLWLSELVDTFGLGRGASLLIYVNIVSNLPTLVKKIMVDNTGHFTIGSFISISILIFASLYGIVFLQRGTRRIPLISSKRLNQRNLRNSPVRYRRRFGDLYLPLKLNQAGVMPIILTTAFLVIPNYIVNLRIFQWLNFLTSFKFVYWIGYFLLVLASSSFYSYLVLNPRDLADQLQRMAVAVPGIRPGLQTTFFFKRLLRRLTLIGAIMLATLTVLPNFIESTLNLTSLSGLSTTSFLILAGVTLDLGREIQNLYYSNFK